MRLTTLFPIIFLLGFSNLVSARLNAQGLDKNQLPGRTDTLSVVGGGPFRFRPFLVPGSARVWVEGIELSEEHYRLDYQRGTLRLNDPAPDVSVQLVVFYRYVPISIATSFRNWPIRNPEDRRQPENMIPAHTMENRSPAPVAGARLQRSGSVSRGITTGTGRDVSIESGLRMQVAGEITGGLRLQAVLTDENTPILPEGSTQRLNEFDRVFIELESDVGSVQLGDFESRLTGGKYAQLRRKLQGVTSFASISPKNESRLQSLSFAAVGATSRGTFRVQSIIPVDGVQGPYRLEGAHGERFIIVLPGSEAVYLDGAQMERGELNDYVIDYATGEVTFTPQRIITSDRRISIEFQYATEQFTRTLLAAEVDAALFRNESGRAVFSVGGSFIREADGDQFGEEFSLSGIDSLTIMESGDSGAFVNGAVPVVYNPEAFYAQYRSELRDIGMGETRQVFVVLSEAPADSIQVFRVSFTRLGPGSGSYERAGLISNGIAYRFVGEGRGEYEPLRALPTPAVKNVFDIRSGFRPTKFLRVHGEWAASLNDQNRLSSLDAFDDRGSAYTFGIEVERVALGMPSGLPTHVSGSWNRSRVEADFSTFERFRSVEHGRKWNLDNRAINPSGGVTQSGNETVDEATTTLFWSDSSFARVGYGEIGLGGAFSGRRWESDFNIIVPNIPNLSFSAESISSKDLLLGESGEWTRQRGRISHILFDSRFIPFAEFENERHEQRTNAADSLVSPSIRFTEVRVGTNWRTSAMAIQAELERRSERKYIGNAWRPFDAWTWSSTLSADPFRSLHTELYFGLRNTRSSSVETAASSSNNSVRVRWNGRWYDSSRGLNLSWLYQAQTERSAILQEIYLRTGQERGEYVWIDENQDNVIQLEEFIPETTPDEGLYIRTFIPSDSLEATTGVSARIRFDAVIGSLLSAGPGNWGRFLAGIRTSTLLDVEERSRTDDLNSIYFLQLGSFRQSGQTLNGRIRVRQELAFFRNLRSFDLTATIQRSESLSELSAGEESQASDLFRLTARYTFLPGWTARVSGDWSSDKQESTSFNSRNYAILSTRVTPSILWAATPSVSLTVAPVIVRKTESIGGGGAHSIRLPLDVRLQLERRMDVLGQFEVATVDVTGNYTGRSSFELTDGRGEGTSYLWRFGLQSRLSDVLTAHLAYDGRAPEGRKTIHTARFELNARF